MLLIFLPAILIPACASSNPVFLMMYSAYKLNKQGDSIQAWRTPFPIWNQSVVLMRRVDSLEKTDAGRDWGQEEKGMTENEMAGWHHWLDGRKSEWTPGVGDGQGGLACWDSWGGRVGHDWTTELRLNVLIFFLLLLPLSRFSRVQLCATP